MSNIKLEVKSYMLDYIRELLEKLDEQRKCVSCDFVEHTIEGVQQKSWRTGELMWEDEEQTKPLWKTEWTYVPKADLTDIDKLKLEAIATIEKSIEKLI